MQWTLLSLAWGLTLSSFTCAFPFDDLQSRALIGALTPDDTCGQVANGNGKGYLCDANSPTGGCCSQYGFCGKTSDYCGVGCQMDFGTCGNLMPKSKFQCGPTYSSQVCDGGLCCSGAGYCGNTTDYCGTTCQHTFGDCTTKLVGDGNTCGPQFGDTTCPAGKCCSPSGYCGTSKEYCGDPDCQYKYGTCDSNTTPAGTPTSSDPRPILGQVPYNTDIDDCIESNVVALTYDDGPFLYTSQLLDTLKKFGFHATFFVTGNNNGKGPIDTTAPYPDLLRRMIAEGHQIASHTWSHYSLDEITSDLRKQQMVKNERAIANIIGKYPTYMRPPYSQCTTAGCKADLQALGYHRVYFDLDTTDYLNPLPTLIQNAKNVVKAALADNSHNDYLSIQHDIVELSVTDLSPYYYNLIKSKGWKGVTVGECLQDPKQNWYRTPGGGKSTQASRGLDKVARLLSGTKSKVQTDHGGTLSNTQDYHTSENNSTINHLIGGADATKNGSATENDLTGGNSTAGYNSTSQNQRTGSTGNSTAGIEAAGYNSTTSSRKHRQTGHMFRHKTSLPKSKKTKATKSASGIPASKSTTSHSSSQTSTSSTTAIQSTQTLPPLHGYDRA